AADDEFLLGAHLHLAPRRRAFADLVDRRGVLGHDAFETTLACRLERLEPIAREAARQTQRSAGTDFLFEHGAPLDERPPHQRLTASEQTVEHDVHGSAPRLRAEKLKA